MADTNKLNYLIPTGEYDIAVREVLIPIFGDAIACKIPGATCGSQTLQDGGAITAAIFSTFNGGTLVFATILLIFIGLFAFTKTALDGEFLGKSWNTTFTALRLIAGVGFLLPLPNGYSTIQNFGMYVTLWSSGFGNEVNLAVSDTYMKRLQHSMIEREPMAGSVENEMRKIFDMHLCVNFLNQQYPTSSLQYKNFNQSTVSGSKNQNDLHYYIEEGTYHPKGAMPCGRFIATKSTAASINDPSDSGMVWGATFDANPFSRDFKKNMLSTADEMSLKIRDVKTEILVEQLKPSSPLGSLATHLVTLYRQGMIQYDDQGNIISVPAENAITAKNAEDFLKSYAIILAKAQNKLTDESEKLQKELSEKSKEEGSGSFLYNARQLLTTSGWMGMSSTYRTMLDLASIKFSPPGDSPYKVEAPSERQLAQYSAYGATGMAQYIGNIKQLFNNIFDSETAKFIIQEAKNSNGVYSDISAQMQPPPITLSSLAKAVEGEASQNTMLGTIYGVDLTNGFRNFIIDKLKISDAADPLFQIKSIGDFITSTAETFLFAEMGARTAIGAFDVAQTAINGSLVGRAANTVLGTGATTNAAVDAVQYILEGIFMTFKAIIFALLSLGYLFSTWLPATPFIAFLMAQLGWVFGAIMTLFALNIWGVMHVTPARNDSFIGSETQGYLMLVSLFFRPAIAVGAMALSYIVAPPIIKLVNMTMLPMMYTTNASTNMVSAIFGSIFCLLLYFTVLKGVIVMIYSIPQSFPDEVMRVINAQTGDLGQSRSMGEMSAGAAGAALAVGTANRMDAEADQRYSGTLKKRKEEADKAKAAHDGKQSAASGATESTDKASQMSGGGETPSAEDWKK